MNIMEGSGIAEDDFANDTTAVAIDYEEFPLTKRMQNAAYNSSGEISDNSSDSTNLETSWNDIHAVSFYFLSFKSANYMFLVLLLVSVQLDLMELRTQGRKDKLISDEMHGLAVAIAGTLASNSCDPCECKCLLYRYRKNR